jgi:hypothetical protein
MHSSRKTIRCRYGSAHNGIEGSPEKTDIKNFKLCLLVLRWIKFIKQNSSKTSVFKQLDKAAIDVVWVPRHSIRREELRLRKNGIVARHLIPLC